MVLVSLPLFSTFDFHNTFQCDDITIELEVEICDGEMYNGYTSTGIYTDTFPASNGCDSIRILNLNVIPAIKKNVRLMKCEGDTVFIGDLIITSSGHYEVALTSSSGCDSIISANVTFHMINADIQIESNTLTAPSGYHSYQWMDCDTGEELIGEDTEILLADHSGSFAIKITSATGCEKISECMDVIVSKTEDVKMKENIMIFPNPAVNILHVINLSGINIHLISVINSTGREVMTIHSPVENYLDISDLNSGMYFVIIQLDSIRIPYKIIVR